MAFEQVRDVIDRARRFHHEIAEFYRQLEDHADKEKVKLILQYLERHELMLEGKLKDFEDDAGANILDTWFKYAPNEEIQKIIAQLVVKDDMSPPEVVNMALKLDDAMLNLYRQAADNAAVDEVRDVFNNLFEEGRKSRDKMVLAIFGFSME